MYRHMNIFEQLLAENDVLLADGATGTNLFALGLQSGYPPEFWNLEEQEKIRKHYRAFIDAGSDIILTNTFGGNRYRLMLHKAENKVVELNSAAVKLALSEIKDSNKKVAIAGCIGPTGEILKPIGTLGYQDAVSAFTEQCTALADAGADVLWIETMSSIDEIKAAVEAGVTTDLPIVYTASIDTNGKTMMGLSAEDIVNIEQELPAMPIALGTNCGVGASEVVAAILAMAKHETKHTLIAKANCGIPEFVDGQIRYNGTPELMAKYAVLARDAGAKIIGGCCGTTPEHIRVMRKALDGNPRVNKPDLEQIEAELGDISPGMKAELMGTQKNITKRIRKKRRR